ncbi:MAG: response regulator [Candidatus Omnitrophica bacterium]|nr:response regulator [Candidatus Omnitrophota bacterium]
MTILIVDDNEQNIYQQQVFLAGNGYETVTAVNGREALEKARKAPPALIISDILMPVMDGFTLCREWRKDARLKSIPFIFYTATYIHEQDREFALSLGADEFLVKPQEPEVFLKIIREVIKRVHKTPPGQDVEPSVKEESVYLKQYNATLIRKLESKMLQLEQKNRDLEESLAERKQAQDKYRELFEDTKDTVYVSSIEGNFLDVNPSGIETFGYRNKEEMLQLDIEKDIYWNPEDRKEIKKLLRGQGFLKDYEVEMKKKNGERLIMLLTASLMKDKKGDVTAYKVIARDITEQKKLLQQLIQAEKMAAIGELLSGVAHEINNPLTAVIGFSELLLKTGDIDEKLRHDIQQIYDSSIRVHKITEGLLRFARKDNLVKKAVNVNSLIEEILKIREYQLRVNNIAVKKICRQDLPLISGDPIQLEQVFLNIINNAEYFMADENRKGILTISTSVEDNYVKVQFADTGPGIPENKITRVFDPFFTTKPQGKGTGLGLSVSYGIIKEHGGNIHVENGMKGGAVFTVILPLKEAKN